MEQVKKKTSRNDYMREYRKKNPHKIAEINARHYAKKAKELEQQADMQQANS